MQANVPKMRLGAISGRARMGRRRLFCRAPRVIAAVMPPRKAKVRLPRVMLRIRRGRDESESWKKRAIIGVISSKGRQLVTQWPMILPRAIKAGERRMRKRSKEPSSASAL